MRIFFVTKLSISYDRALLFLVVSLWLRFIAKLKLECNLFFQGRLNLFHISLDRT